MEEKKKISNKDNVLALIVGIVIGAIIMFAVSYIINNNTVIKVAGKSIRKNELYTTMKDYFSAGLISDEIDNKILVSKYKLTDSMKKEIENEADYYIKQWEAYYGYTEEQFLTENGFKNKEEFEEYLALDYRRNLYYYDYLEGKLEEGAVEKYYEENKDSVDKAENEHILITTDNMTDEEALTLAKEIIQKVNDGKTFKEIEEEYGTDKVTYQELGFVGKEDSIVEEYLNALFALKDGEYSQEPVKTQFGYHIIHRTATSKLEDVRKDIINILAKDIIDEDTNLKSKILVELRNQNKLEIKDDVLKKKYDSYVKNLEDSSK